MSSLTIPASTLEPEGTFSARAIVVDTYRFALGHAGAILGAVAVPVILAAAVLLFLFKAYFSLLAYYLSAPSWRVASLTMSVLAAGFFVWLLLNIMACAGVARIVRGDGGPHSPGLRRMALEARLYAAVLRYLAVLAAGAAVSEGLVSFSHHFLLPRHPDYAALIAWPLFALFAAVFFVRCGVLLPALAAYERSRVLRRGWQLSQGRSWRLAAVGVAVFVIPAIVLQTLGEYLRMLLDNAPFAPNINTLEDAARMMAMNGTATIVIALSLSISIAVCQILATIGSCLAYRRLAAPQA